MDFITSWSYTPPELPVMDSTDLVERAGYMTLKQMVDQFSQGGQVFSNVRASYHDFDDESEIESSSPELWDAIVAYRAAGVDDIDIDSINKGYVEYLMSKGLKPATDSSYPPDDSDTTTEATT